MQLEQLRYLILIHRLGSINKASEQVHLSQQALNTSMKKLEAEIGCPLFIYHARGVRLTDKGLRLVKTAEEVLAKMDDTLRELRETEPVLRDRIEPLTIFFTPAIGQLFMTNVTKVFSQAHPYVRFTLLEEEGATIRRLILEEDRPALGIVATFDPIPAADAAHTTISLYKDKLYILVAATHPLARQKSVSIRTLLKYPLAVYNPATTSPIRSAICSKTAARRTTRSSRTARVCTKTPSCTRTAPVSSTRPGWSITQRSRIFWTKSSCCQSQTCRRSKCTRSSRTPISESTSRAFQIFLRSIARSAERAR